MASPSTDPVSLQVLAILAAAMAQITPANGYYSTVAAAGFEPVNFVEGDPYPQIVVQEASAEITQANKALYTADAVYAISGYLPTASADVIANAHRLRADIARALGQIISNKSMFEIDGKRLVEIYNLAGPLEVSIVQDSQDFVQAKAHLAITFTQLF